MSAAPSLGSPRLTRLQQRLLLEVDHARTLIEDTAARCPPADPAAVALLAQTRAQLDAWETRVRAPPRPLSAARDHEAIQRLSRWRVYLLTPAELAFESLGALRRMREEGVPARVLDDLDALRTAEVLPAANGVGALAHARAATARILEARDTWVTLGEQHALTTQVAAVLLSATALVALCTAAYVLDRQILLPGFLLGGVTGSAVSIATRLPPFDTIGTTRSLTRRLMARFAVGLAACAAGLGLLASGLITLPVGGMPMHEVIARCTSHTSLEGCTTPSMLALLAVAIVLGFSERALVSFEQVVLGAGTGKGKPEAATATPRKAEAATGDSSEAEPPSSNGRGGGAGAERD
jgi:hypothetical protein